jgi:hypothetical protein
VINDRLAKNRDNARKPSRASAAFAADEPKQDIRSIRIMSNVDTRHVNRDSLFLLAQVRVDGQNEMSRVKVRNLSAGGMMAEGEAKIVRGTLVAVELRNLGWVEGSVAWKQDNRFGIAFVNEIDPAAVRAPPASQAPDFDAPRYTRNHQAVPLHQLETDSKLRKI